MKNIRVHHNRKKHWHIKKVITIIVLIITYTSKTWAYDFSSLTPAGQTLYYTINDSTTVTVTSGKLKPVGELTIPSTVTHNGQTYSVTAIGDSLFDHCSGLTGVIIPNTVTTIGNAAFRYCESLTSVIIPNSVTAIGDYAFYACSSLTSVTIPNSVTTIGIWAFYACSSLTSVTIPNSVTTIGILAFYACSSLTSVTIPNSVTTIDEGVFYGCSSLTSVTIPNSVTTISFIPFESTNVNSIILGCTTPPEVTTISLPGSASHPITFHVPCNTAGVYRNTAIWNRSYYQYVEDIGCPIQVIASTNDSSLGTVSGGGTYLMGQTVTLKATPNSNCHFEAWEDGNIQNPRNITIDSGDTDVSHTAIFAIDTYYVVNALPNNSDLGAVTGGGRYLSRKTAMLRARPMNDCIFVRWSDGDSTNPRAHHVVSDTTLTAIFRINPDTVMVHDTTYVPLYDTIVIHDTVSSRLSYYEVIVHSANIESGVVAGNGRFPDSTHVEIAAIPIEGYRFEQWQDSNSDNPRVIQIKGGDATYVATFVPSVQAIGSIESDEEVAITTHDGQITVTNVGNRVIRLFDSVGRHLTTSDTAEDTRHFTLPASGVYLLQVGTAPARRVVVVK